MITIIKTNDVKVSRGYFQQNFTSTDTVFKIKERIAQRFNWKAELIFLKLKGKYLNNDNNFSLQVPEENECEMECKFIDDGPMQIMIRFSTKLFFIEILPSDSVWSLKKRLSERFGYNTADLRLCFNASQMNDSLCLYDYGVESNHTIQLIRSLYGGNEFYSPSLSNNSTCHEGDKDMNYWNITVQNKDTNKPGEKFRFDFSPSLTILMLKENIANHFNYNVNEIQIVFDQMALINKDNLTLKTCGIEFGSELVCIFKPVRSMLIQAIDLRNRKKYDIEVLSSDSVSHFIKKLSFITAKCSRLMRVSYDGKFMHHSRSLLDYDIEPGGEIVFDEMITGRDDSDDYSLSWVFECRCLGGYPCGWMKRKKTKYISVDILGVKGANRSVEFDFSSCTTVLMLKMDIAKHLDCDVKQITLLHNNRRLHDDNMCLSENDVTNKSKLKCSIDGVGPMLITINTMGADDYIGNIVLDFTPSKTISFVKKSIMKHYQCLFDDIQLKLCEENISDDNASLDDCGITNGAELFCVIRNMKPIQIIIKTFGVTMSDSDRHEVTVFPFESLNILKKKIVELFDKTLAIGQIQVVYHGRVLHFDTVTLQKYGMTNGAEVYWNFKQITINTICRKKSFEKIVIDFHPNDTILMLKKKVAEICKCSVDEIQLRLKHVLLKQDTLTLEEYGVRDELDCVFGPVEIYAVDGNDNGRIFAVEVLLTDTVLSVKQKLSKRNGKSASEMILIHTPGQTLNDSMNLNYFEIEPGDILQLNYNLQ